MADTLEITRHDRVVLVRLNRPKAFNALNSTVMHEIVEALKPLDRNPDVGCFVITGSEKSFAAGADIKEMSDESYMEMFMRISLLAGMVLQI